MTPKFLSFFVSIWMWPGLVVGDPVHSRGLKLDDHYGPFQLRPFYDSMILPVKFGKRKSRKVFLLSNIL
mgnify:CR=1 FL=1